MPEFSTLTTINQLNSDTDTGYTRTKMMIKDVRPQANIGRQHA